MKQVFSAILLVILAIVSAGLFFTFFQVQEEESRLTNDLERRAVLLAESLQETIEPYVIAKNTTSLQNLVERFANRERLMGIITYDNKDNILAASSNLSPKLPKLTSIVTSSMDENSIGTDFIHDTTDQRLYVLSKPLHNKESVIGALVIVHNASYIDSALYDIWRNSLLRLISYSLLITIALFVITQWVINKPITGLVNTIRTLRKSGDGEIAQTQFSKHYLFQPLINEVSSIHKSLIEAQSTASYEARLRLEKLDSPWTAERLKEFTKSILKGKEFYVVSNREPYIHVKKGNEVSYIQPASGMVTAIDPLMKACGGIWIAHGSGSGDKEVVDTEDKVVVPPDEPKYTLKRIWLTEKEEKGYYYGFSNDGLWPLCHGAFVEPVLRKEDWEEYQNVNGKFAKALLKEIKGVHKPLIFIQDYLFTLLPQYIKEARPDATVALFWHIPWPNSESFRICPWRKEILSGMLGADLIAFHTQLHCNNFIDTVSKEIESLIDLEQFAIQKDNHISFVKPFPIGVAFPEESNSAIALDKEERKKFLEYLKVYPTEYIGIGIDRMDYTKGIPERFKAIERFFEKYPHYKEKFTFIQIAPSSRSTIPSYQHYSQTVYKELERINGALRTRYWKPIVFINKHQDRKEINKIYNLGNICLVTSLDDGMNLVAKEYVAARSDEKGVLILSQFTGASRELKEALIINPYDTETMAESIKIGLEMPQSEQTKRMRKLRESIKNNNIYRWSAEILKTIVSLSS